MTDVSQERVIDLEAVAAHLGVTVQAVRNWSKRPVGPRLETFNAGRLIRTTWSAVNRFLEAEQLRSVRRDVAVVATITAPVASQSSHEESLRTLRRFGIDI